MPNGATATFSLIVNVAPAAPTGTLNNTANVSTTATDPVGGNNASTAQTIITSGNADLSITKTAGPPPYTAGGQVTYTIVVTNGGPAPASNVVVTDVLPPGTTFNSATPTQGSCSVTCNIGTLANGATATIMLTITLSANPGPVSNTASASSANPDPNPANSAAAAAFAAVLPTAIPMLSPFALLLLGIALGMAGLFVQRMR
jgi:uncharacterized repeat protein (TIGR01451 family)